MFFREDFKFCYPITFLVVGPIQASFKGEAKGIEVRTRLFLSITKYKLIHLALKYDQLMFMIQRHVTNERAKATRAPTTTMKSRMFHRSLK